MAPLIHRPLAHEKSGKGTSGSAVAAVEQSGTAIQHNHGLRFLLPASSALIGFLIQAN